MLKGYMRDRAAMFGCLLICYGTLFLIGYLYDIPFEKTRYIAEFSGAGERAEAVHCHLRYLSGHVLYSAGRSGSVVPFDDRKDETGEGRAYF